MVPLVLPKQAEEVNYIKIKYINLLVAYNINILPKLLTALSTGPATIDRNPAHWIINGLYVGTGIEGAATTTVIVDSVSLIGQHI